jgi:hypothetical protein
MAYAIRDLPPEISGRIGHYAMRPHPLARLMADVRRYEGVWRFVGFDGRLCGKSEPYSVYAFEGKTRFFLVLFDGELAFTHLDNIVYSKPARSPCPDAARG